MKNSFFKFRTYVIVNLVCIVPLFASVLWGMIDGDLIFAIIFLLLITIGLSIGLPKQEIDRVLFDEEGMKVLRLLRTIENVKAVKYGRILEKGINYPTQLRPVKRIVVHARSEDETRSITIYMENRKEILDCITHYREYYGG